MFPKAGTRIFSTGALRAVWQAAANFRNTQTTEAETATAQFQEIRIPVPWGHIAGKLWGDPGKPMVICNHGYNDNAASYDAIAPYLSKRFCFLAHDYPGHGQSSHIPPGMTYQESIYVTANEFTRRHFGMEKVRLMGHSMGALQCMNYALCFNSAVKFLIGLEINTHSYNPFKPRLMHLGRRIDKMIGQESKRGKEKARKPEVLIQGMLAGYGGSLDEHAARQLLARGTKEQDGRWWLTRDIRCQNNQIIGTPDYDYHRTRFPKKADADICLIEADSGIRFSAQHSNSRAIMDLYTDNYKSVEYHTIPGHHHFHMTGPQAVADIINAFLDRTDP